MPRFLMPTKHGILPIMAKSRVAALRKIRMAVTPANIKKLVEMKTENNERFN